MYDRCIHIVTQQLAGRAAAAAAGQPTDQEPERDFIVCSLDVIAGPPPARHHAQSGPPCMHHPLYM